ncbi:hypothetical protein OAF35_06815 [Verrucomicrobiales bacterium]|nr:hypothetical protein [Verrucomicrobiales bacterium]
MKTFIEIINLAKEKGWCMKPFCTTCGCCEFRGELRKLSEEYESGLVDALCATSLSALQNSLNWKDAVRVSLGDISDGKGLDKVLKSWLPNLKENIGGSGSILFR